MQLPTKEDSSGGNKVLNGLGECSAKLDELEGNFAKFPLGSAIGNKRIVTSGENKLHKLD